MEHIAAELDLDPVQVRLENLSQTTPDVEKYMKELIEWAEVDKRKKEVEDFNKVLLTDQLLYGVLTVVHKINFRPTDGLKKDFLWFQCYTLFITLDTGM